jgi:DNA-binding XRE family transcriptional regulator
MTAKQLQAVRHRLKLNTAELGRYLTVSARTVEDWEQGRRGIPAVVELVLTGCCPTCCKNSPELRIKPIKETERQ